MVHYKLFYFPFRGRAEAIRQLFILAGVPFDDVKVPPQEWPQKYKPNMPFGQMPVLEVDGEQIAQMMTILRFLGRQLKLDGNTPVESAKLDMYSELVQELASAPGVAQWGAVLLGIKQVDSKEKYFNDEVKPVIADKAPVIEKVLEKNGNGLFLGNKETWLDVFAADIFSRFLDFGAPDALNGFPNILKLINKVHNVPAIKEHIAQRGPVPA